ncbi:haloacid dehalogenase-like hydrolase [Verrucomicrobiales bacterium]|nr:haloacid dehalogenase-like hydrolase [Verrucomicrobiales bacterium]
MKPPFHLRDMARGYALFDLDHTILPFDTQALFCNYVLQREGWRRIYLLWFIPCLPLVALKILNLRTMKRVFASYLVGMKRERLMSHVSDFLESDFQTALYPAVVAEIERNRSEGRLLILNSASPEFYLEGISDQLGFDHFIGTDMEVREKMALFPKISGPNNKHGAKITAMQTRGLIPDDVEVLANSWAYSDSSADIPLLSVTEHGVMIHPGAKLDAVGMEKGWRMMTPARPYDGKWSGRWASLLQSIGCYQVRSVETNEQSIRSV